MPEAWKIILCCEHGSRAIPPEFAHVFQDANSLEEHRWWDPGAKDMTLSLAEMLDAPFFMGSFTRLLVDLNRSFGNPSRWSEFSRTLPADAMQAIDRSYYGPYWEQVESAIRRETTAGHKVLHLSIHSFTPVMQGKMRNVDVGLLFDPARTGETNFCNALGKSLERTFPNWAIAHNQPYRGVDDGVTTQMRLRFPDESYLGIEFELNFKHVHSPEWPVLMQRLVREMADVIR